MGQFNQYSDGVGTERKAEKKDLLGAEPTSTAWMALRNWRRRLHADSEGGETGVR